MISGNILYNSAQESHKSSFMRILVICIGILILKTTSKLSVFISIIQDMWIDIHRNIARNHITVFYQSQVYGTLLLLNHNTQNVQEDVCE